MSADAVVTAGTGATRAPAARPGAQSGASDAWGTDGAVEQDGTGHPAFTTDAVVAVDVGGTKTAAAIVERDGSVGEVLSAPTRAVEGPDVVLGVITDLVAQLNQRNPHRTLRAVGVGTAGIVDAKTGTILAANETFPGWPGTPVREVLTDRLGVPVHVQNDVDAHAAGEAWCGAAAGARLALVVAVGTGVGSALVLDGFPLTGAHHAQGEIGHMPIGLAAGVTCPCGRTGHLEAVACGPAIATLYALARADRAQTDGAQTEGAPASAQGGAQSPVTLSTPQVLELADAGDPLAREVVVRAGRALGQAIAGTVTVIDPDVVVLGGGVAGRSSIWWQAMEQTVREELVPPLHQVPLRLSSLGGLAPLAGAGHAGWRIADGGQGW